jgi:hypothetical protein
LSFAQGVPAGTGEIEPIIGLQADREGVTFQVSTGGCTREHETFVVINPLRPIVARPF